MSINFSNLKFSVNRLANKKKSYFVAQKVLQKSNNIQVRKVMALVKYENLVYICFGGKNDRKLKALLGYYLIK